MRIETPEQHKGVTRIAALAYAVSGQGKTTLLTHLPEEGDSWVDSEGKPGKIIYIAADKTSPSLASVSPKDRTRIIKVIPDGNAKLNPKTGALETNWQKEISQICQRSWKEKYPDAVAVVYDAVTPHCEQLLDETMVMGNFNPVGPQSSGIDPSAMTKAEYQEQIKKMKEEVVKLGDRGDYRMVQGLITRQVRWLLDMNSDMHVLVAAHECMGDREGGAGAIFGPATVGAKGPRQLPQLFDTVLWLSQEDGTGGGRAGTYRVALRNAEKHIAKVATHRGAEVPAFKWLENVEDVRKFWAWMLEVRS